MFRRIEATLDPDPSFPSDLKYLGFFVNTLGQIRQMNAPDKEYAFCATNNERVNEVRREAMQECMRQETEKRLAALGISRVYLPGFETTKPDGPHIAIFSPAPDILKIRRRVIVLVNDAVQDLGILSYGQMQRELGINGASAVNFIKKLISRSATSDAAAKCDEIYADDFKLDQAGDTPAVIIANTGQLLYSHKHNKAMTLRSWSAMSRKSAVHDMIRIHDNENRVPGHRSPQKHLKSVFDEVLCDTERVAMDAEIYLIAIESGTENVLNLFMENFAKYGSRITAMALVHSLIDDSQIKDPSVRDFLHQRTREWRFSSLTTNPQHCVELPVNFHQNKQITFSEPSDINNATKHISWNENVTKIDTVSGIASTLDHLTVQPVAIKKGEASAESTQWPSNQAVVCPTFAGGESVTGECVFTDPAVQHAILSFFEEVAREPKHDHNSNIKMIHKAPQPTSENPLALDPGDFTIPNPSSVPPEMMAEQAELDMAKKKLEQMKLALKTCPTEVEELQTGRKKLAQRIANQETRTEKLEKEALAHGGLRADESIDLRENWKPSTGGPKVKFAGTLIDSELLKAAGLGETAEDELRKLSK